MQTIKINDDNTLSIELSTGDRYTLREPLAKDMEGLGQDLIKVKHTDTVQKAAGQNLNAAADACRLWQVEHVRRSSFECCH